MSSSVIGIDMKNYDISMGNGNVRFPGGGLIGKANTLGNISITGNVGIGTSNPTATLDVNGAMVTRSTITLNNTGLTNANYLIFNNGTNIYAVQQVDNSLANYFRLGRNGYSDIVVNSTGNVGIGGTSNPATTLSLGTLNANIKLGLYDDGTGTNLYGIGANSANLTFTAGGTTPQMVLRNSGSVGIGTTNPAAKLDVNGTMIINNSTANSGYLNINTAATGNYNNPPDNVANQGYGLTISSTKSGSSVYVMGFGTDYGTGCGFINNAGNALKQPIALNARGGNVGIGTVTPAATLDVSGTLKYNNYYFNFSAASNLAITNGGTINFTNNSGTPYYNSGYTQAGYFTAPVSGYYHLNYTYTLVNSPVNASNWMIGFYKDTATPPTRTFGTSSTNFGDTKFITIIVSEYTNISFFFGTLSTDIYLSANERIYVIASNNISSPIVTYSWGSPANNRFTGYLISQ